MCTKYYIKYITYTVCIIIKRKKARQLHNISSIWSWVIYSMHLIHM